MHGQTAYFSEVLERESMYVSITKCIHWLRLQHSETVCCSKTEEWMTTGSDINEFLKLYWTMKEHLGKITLPSSRMSGRNAWKDCPLQRHFMGKKHKITTASVLTKVVAIMSIIDIKNHRIVHQRSMHFVIYKLHVNLKSEVERLNNKWLKQIEESRV